ncbi:BTB/POZ domain-containing protein 2a isoform X2 [Triplophysa dalaica]|uniref:BTB/POZ domain-containing protein 2a isoform X2 n=1 Tax=Triplophysa dalaica TaxID=1582913 RepID=UPI0024DFC6F9|nr:BTB/POZ domain-containing protein 2a isoform X2 [Triplophysa dalaica]
MRCCVCLCQRSLQCSPSKMAAGESNSRSSCLNLSNSGPLGNAPPSNVAHSSPASNGGAAGAAGGMNRNAGNSNPLSGPENGGGADSSVRIAPSTQNPPRQSIGQSAAAAHGASASGAITGAASNMTATSSSSSSSSSTSTASDASAAAVSSLPSSPASVLVYREPVYNWQATKSTVKERFALAVGSAVFDAMFNGGMATTSTEIELPDVEPAAFLALLKFLYSDEVQIGPETVMTTLYSAKKYAVPALEAHCVEFLKKNLRADNAFMLLTQARLFDEPQLASLCLENIDKNTADALAAEGFTDIDLDTLVAVLERDTLGVREVRLFGAAVRWAEAEAQRQQLQTTPENKRRVLGKALSLIRFPLMTIEEFAAGPAQSGILADREVVSLFLHFTVNPKPHVEFIDRPRCCLRGKECSITRFSQVESRWGYSGTSDRIRFSVNRRIFVVGFGLYGSIHGPTDYQVNIQIIHTDSNTVLGQNDTGFSCDGTASTFRVMFKEPVEILPSVNYIACATLKGPDSHYGTKGMRKVTHEAPATGIKTCFTFCYAAGNNNGTSVEDGQIPEVIFYT